MRVGEGEGGPNLAEQPRLTHVQPPTLPISGEVAAGDREGPTADEAQYPTELAFASFTLIHRRSFILMDEGPSSEGLLTDPDTIDPPLICIGFAWCINCKEPHPLELAAHWQNG